MDTTIDPRAIVIGSVVDNVATFALVSALPLLAGRTMESDRLLFAFEGVGLLCTLFGGYVAARIATTAPLRHGAMVGAVALGIGVLSQVGPAAELPGWYTASAFALVVPAGTLGGLLAQLRFRARSE